MVEIHDKKEIIESLSVLERKIFPILSKDFENIEELSKKVKLDKTSILRALEFLKAKELVEINQEEKKFVIAGINGIYYLKKGLPERRLLNELGEKNNIQINDIEKVCNLNENESKVALGILKKKAIIRISSSRVILDTNRREIEKKMFEESFLEKLPLELEKLEPQEKFAFQNLKSRKDIIQIEEEKDFYAKLTNKGIEISKMDLDENLIEQLTPKIIKSNLWKGKKFRRYNLTAPVPKIYGGKKHFVNQAAEYAKKIWIEMGFKEMTGSIAETGFWHYDALFQPQDHPAREMQDTFYIKGVEGKLPNKKLVEAVKRAHEGGIDKSKGWQQEHWDEKQAKKVLLRSHTTCLSSRMLYNINETKEFPAKYFALGKVLRNETVDWYHSFEFNQTEGIVVDENANFTQLIGYLVEFFKKMGYEKIRTRPGYFPYTEPSLEIDVYHPTKKKWVELGGAGMFRPEVTIPMFGKHIPVLAWGPGFDRIIMEYFNILDLREMYKNNITQLRNMKAWMK